MAVEKSSRLFLLSEATLGWRGAANAGTGRASVSVSVSAKNDSRIPLKFERFIDSLLSYRSQRRLEVKAAYKRRPEIECRAIPGLKSETGGTQSRCKNCAAWSRS